MPGVPLIPPRVVADELMVGEANSFANYILSERIRYIKARSANSFATPLNSKLRAGNRAASLCVRGKKKGVGLREALQRGDNAVRLRHPESPAYGPYPAFGAGPAG